MRITDEEAENLLSTMRTDADKLVRQDAFEALYEAYNRWLCGFVRLHAKKDGDVDDISQRVWMSLWTSVSTRAVGENRRRSADEEGLGRRIKPEGLIRAG